MNHVEANSAEEIAALVASQPAVYTHQWAPNQFLANPTCEDGIQLVVPWAQSGLVIDTDNQVAVVDASLPLAYVQGQLFGQQLCLPFPSWEDTEEANFRFVGGQVGRLMVDEAIGMNFPHAAEAEHGNWRDWILGMTVVLGDGTIAKSGSQAVKNVAGYDAHKLFIGARGTLGIIREVILRVRPKSVMKKPDLIWGPYRGTPPYMIHRVLPSDFSSAIADAGEDLIAGDPAMGTVWRKVRNREIPRYAHDWTWSSNGEWSVSNTQRVYLERAKKLLDPEGKLNPGLMGIF